MRIRRRKPPAPEVDQTPPPRKRRRKATSPTVQKPELTPLELETPNATSPVGELLSLDLPLLQTLVQHGCGYRGDLCIQWTGEVGPSPAFAVMCRCARWWGWFPENVVLALRSNMLLKGCRVCA